MFNSYFCVALLCIINLLNYMDRFTIAGVLNQIQDYFQIDDSQSGLLQTAFICSYMIFAPLFGFLGDRYSRKLIIIGGVVFWSIITLSSSFVKPHHTGLFFLFRGLVGVGEASYSTVAPTIIADLFVGKRRSTMIALFYFAIPVGSGLGYIVGSQMLSIFGGWEWSLRFTPPLGIISAICFIFVKEPKRGGLDQNNVQDVPIEQSPTGFGDTIRSLILDIKYLLSVPTFLLTTFGFTCVCFATGALSWWAPHFMSLALPDISFERINFLFGVIACISGIVGVLIGTSASQFFRTRYSTIDPIICGIGVLLSVPCTILTLVFARSNPTFAWFNIFLAITFLSTNWSVVVDILLYVIMPNRRSIAQSIQILISHILGDASSPFIVGALSSALSSKKMEKFESLKYALFLTPLAMVLSGFFFLYSAKYLSCDKLRCKNRNESSLSQNETSTMDHSTLIGNSSSNSRLIQQ